MNLRCQHCDERIVARSFGKCPKCLKELPAELKLSEEEQKRADLSLNRTRNSLQAYILDGGIKGIDVGIIGIDVVGGCVMGGDIGGWI